MKKFHWLRHLLSSSKELSIRRFIAFVLLFPYVIGIFIGIFVGLSYQDFKFFLTSILAAGIPIMITFFVLSWQHVVEIVRNVKDFIIKKDEPIE